MWKLGFVSPPLNISGETSSALRVLPDGVKLVWVGAQGYNGGLGVDRVGTPID